MKRWPSSDLQKKASAQHDKAAKSKAKEHSKSSAFKAAVKRGADNLKKIKAVENKFKKDKCKPKKLLNILMNLEYSDADVYEAMIDEEEESDLEEEVVVEYENEEEFEQEAQQDLMSLDFETYLMALSENPMFVV